MSNTKLFLQYRTVDVSITQSVVLAGAITAQQIQAIAEALYDYNCLIARQVGLPSPWEKLLEHGFVLDHEVDHVYTRMLGFEHGTDQLPVPSDFHTDEAPTRNQGIGELVDLIAAQTLWDIDAELKVQGPHYASTENFDFDEEPQMAFRSA